MSRISMEEAHLVARCDLLLFSHWEGPIVGAMLPSHDAQEAGI